MNLRLIMATLCLHYGYISSPRDINPVIFFHPHRIRVNSSIDLTSVKLKVDLKNI